MARALWFLLGTSLLGAAGSFIWEVWATALAPEGHKFNATQLPMAVSWTCLISAGVFCILAMWAEDRNAR